MFGTSSVIAQKVKRQLSDNLTVKEFNPVAFDAINHEIISNDIDLKIQKPTGFDAISSQASRNQTNRPAGVC